MRPSSRLLFLHIFATVLFSPAVSFATLPWTQPQAACMRNTFSGSTDAKASGPMHRSLRVPSMLAAREAQLHNVARKHILRGYVEDAHQCYQIAIEEWGSPRSFLLAALLMSRCGRVTDARQYFSSGVVTHRTDAQLLQAWGLFESKQDVSGRAVRLLRRAVKLDPSLEPVLSWSRFRDANAVAPQQPVSVRSSPGTMRMTPRARLNPVMRTSSPAEVAQDSRAGMDAPEGGSGHAPSCFVPQLPVLYTVPQSSLGWKGRTDKGEDPESWYDNEGPRKGPPTNYWRQSLDERQHRRCFDAVEALLSTPSDADFDDAPLRELEFRMSIKKPMANRRLLGRWGPIVLNGDCVATASKGGVSDETGFAVPQLITIARATGRKTVQHRYGEIDEHMTEGEPIEVRVTLPDAKAQSDDVTTATVLSATTEARTDNERCEVTLGGGYALHVGGVTFLNEYILVARDRDGQLKECYVRVPDSGEANGS